jgi:hypothetical protein
MYTGVGCTGQEGRGFDFVDVLVQEKTNHDCRIWVNSRDVLGNPILIT